MEFFFLILFAFVFIQEFEKNFYLVGTHKHLSCSSAVSASVLSAIKSSLSKDTTTSHELYFNYFANKYVGNAVDDATKTRLAANLQTILKADDSLSKWVWYGFFLWVFLAFKFDFWVSFISILWDLISVGFLHTKNVYNSVFGIIIIFIALHS